MIIDAVKIKNHYKEQIPKKGDLFKKGEINYWCRFL